MKLIQKTLQFGAFVLLATCSSSRKFQTNESPLDSKEKNNIQNNVYAGQDAQLSEEQYEVLSNAVFELVLPRKEDTFVEYEEKLPEHLLPYKLRKSPYRGIGTAFVVASPKGHRFVSAAHVFDLHELTLAGPVALRDADGKIYEIDQILKYSQHRDLIEFTLKKAPKNMKPLRSGKTK